MNYFLQLLLTLFALTTCLAQNEGPYKIKGNIDWPVNIGTTSLTILGFYQLSQKDKIDPMTISNLNYEKEVSKVDQWLEPHFSKRANRVSDHIFYPSFALPLGLLTIKNMRDDMATLGMLYWQVMGITGALYSNVAAFSKDKLRPIVYTDAPLEDKTDRHNRFSFYGGHPSAVAASTFFIAKVLSDYYPYRKGLKWISFGTATGITLTMAYLRHRAGKHYITGLATGVAVGALAGILVPELHKKRDEDKALSIRPFGGAVSGLMLTYEIK